MFMQIYKKSEDARPSEKHYEKFEYDKSGTNQIYEIILSYTYHERFYP